MNTQRLTLRQRFSLGRFIRGEAPSSGAIILNQRRVFILPTRRGLGFALLIVIVLLIAFVYNNNLAYMLDFLLASIFFVSILHSYNALAGLVIRSGQHQPVFVGDKAGFNFTLQNPINLHRFAVSIQLQGVYEIDIEPLQTQNVTLYVEALKRGWQACDTVTVFSCYPLGLFRAWSPLRFDSRILVYPQPASMELAFPENGAAEAGTRSQRLRGDDEFHGLKTYQPGDAIRQIHWRAYAKGRGLHSKQYASSGSHEFWLDYAQTPGRDIEERLSNLCRWVIEAERAGLSYGLSLPGTKLLPDNGREHYQACLQALALF